MLSERQQIVLRALVSAYVAEAAPVGSATISTLLPVRLSSASIRHTMGELAELGLIDKPHTSAGRVPTEEGLRIFVKRLMAQTELAAYDRQTLERSFGLIEADSAVQHASRLLSEYTRLLGFVVAPCLERVVLRHVSLVRLTRDRLLVVLISRSGQSHRRLVNDTSGGDQAELDRIALLLNDRVAGRTISDVRSALERESRALRDRADRAIRQAVELGLEVLAAQPGPEPPLDLVIATRLALLDQPEFNDPDRVRDLLAALETHGRLEELLAELVESHGVSVTLGADLDEPGLRDCALIAAPYSGEVGPLGVLGVIGPSRMDYGRIIPFVRHCSRLVTEKLHR